VLHTALLTAPGTLQRDPLVEYKLEGYNLFLEMMANIRRNVIYNVYVFQPRRNPEARFCPSILYVPPKFHSAFMLLQYQLARDAANHSRAMFPCAWQVAQQPQAQEQHAEQPAEEQPTSAAVNGSHGASNGSGAHTAQNGNGNGSRQTKQQSQGGSKKKKKAGKR
jgi:preprotein translocase subunit SecA